MLDSIGRVTGCILLLLVLITVLPESGFGDPMFPELIVNAGDVVIHRSHSSVLVEVYVENVIEPIGGIDLWLTLGHNLVVEYQADSVWLCDTVYFNCQDSSCTEWDGSTCIAWEFFNCDDSLLCSWKQAGAAILEGTAIQNWEFIKVLVHDPQRMMLQLLGIANTGGGTPPIPAGGNKLLAKLVCIVADTTGSIPDSLCDDPDLYEMFGETLVKIDLRSKFSDQYGDDLIGWIWSPVCKDSTCTDWQGDSCVQWECTEWDSVHHVDTTKLFFYDGSVTLDCSSCDWNVGDADGSIWIDIDDVVYIINYIFGGGPPPVPHELAGDADCSTLIDIDDVVYLINYIFGGGPPPPCECQDLL